MAHGSGSASLSESLEFVRGLATGVSDNYSALLQTLVSYREFEATRVPKSTGDRYELSLSLLLHMHNSENYKNLDKDLYRELVTACKSLDSTVDSIIRAAVKMAKVYRPQSTPQVTPQSSAGSAASAPRSITLDTPLKTSAHLSRSAEGRKLDSLIFEEMEYHVYRGVEGFFETHYNQSKWSQKECNAYNAILKHHKNGKWEGFPTKSKEKLVRAWLVGLLSEVGSGSKNVMDTNVHSNEMDGDVKAQMDLFFRERGADGARPNPFTYRHVLAVGELKRTDNQGRFKAVFLQLAKHVYYISRAQPTRIFVHAFTLTGKMMELWVFDPAGAYSSGRFDIHSRDGKIKFVTAIVALATMDHSAMGLNTKVDGDTVEMMSVDNTPIMVTLMEPIYSQRSMTGRGTCCWTAKLTSRTQVQSSPPAKKAKIAESQPSCVVKAAWRVDRREPTELDMLRELEDSEGVVKVLGFVEMSKVSDIRKGLKFNKKRHHFRSTPQMKEDNFDPRKKRDSERHRVNERDSQLEELITSSNRRRRSKGLAAQTDNWKEAELEADCYDDRTLIYIAIAPVGTVLTQLTGPRDIMYAGRGAAVGLRCLFRNHILHRDVSPANIVLSVRREEREADPDPDLGEGPLNRDEKRIEGALVDLDVAMHVHNPSVSGALQCTDSNTALSLKTEEREADPDPEKAPEKQDEERHEGRLSGVDVARRADRLSVSGAMQRTGSRIYTAVGVLKGETHTFRHDVESLFYSLLDMCSRLIWETPEFRSSKKKPRKFWTINWLEGPDDWAADTKFADMNEAKLELIIKQFPKPFKPLRRLFIDLWELIFGVGPVPNLETPDDPEVFFGKLVSTFDSTIQRHRRTQSTIGSH